MLYLQGEINAKMIRAEFKKGAELRVSLNFDVDNKTSVRGSMLRSVIYGRLTKEDQWYPTDIATRLVRADQSSWNYQRWQQLAQYARDDSKFWRTDSSGFSKGDIEVTAMIANRDPNYFRLFFKRPLKLSAGDDSLRLPVNETVKLSVAWSIVDSTSQETSLSLVRGERRGDLPIWKDFRIIDVPGSPVEPTDVIQV